MRDDPDEGSTEGYVRQLGKFAAAGEGGFEMKDAFLWGEDVVVVEAKFPSPKTLKGEPAQNLL